MHYIMELHIGTMHNAQCTQLDITQALALKF
jgi:hypothetical protein